MGIGSAIDFTHHTFQKLREEQQKILTTNNEARNPIINISSPYLEEPYSFSRALYDSGNDYLLCHNPPGREADNRTNLHLKLKCPVRFLHGSEDDVVQWTEVTNAAKILQSKFHGDDILAQLLEGGDHRLSRSEDISVLLDMLDEFV